MSNTQNTRSILMHASSALDKRNPKFEKLKYKNPSTSIQEKQMSSLKADHIRIEMIYAGICGTDLHLLQKDSDGFVLTSAPFNIPPEGRIIGHEGIGRVVSVGSQVSGFKLGDIVGLESIITCKNCSACRRGNFNQCVHAKLLGMQTDGIFSAIADVPESSAHNVNTLTKDEDGLRSAACLEPAGVAWLACHNAAIASGDAVLIFGGGPIGFFCAMIAKLFFGASKVTLVDPILFRRTHAKKWCDEVHENLNDKVYLSHYDVVIEASGFLTNIQPVIECINPNGRVALLARSGHPLEILNVDHLITNSISIFGVRGHLGGAIGRIINLCEAGLLPLHEAVTNILPSIDALYTTLNDPNMVTESNCKVLAKLS